MSIKSEIIFHPGEKYRAEFRFWQGCPTICRTPKGRLFAGWYSGGSKEPSPLQYNLLMRSDDDGLTWNGPELVIDSVPEKQIRAIDIQLWMAPDNKMWLFWCERDDHFPQADENHLFTCAMVCDDPDAETQVWSEPRRISVGFLRCQPTVLADGRILLCAYDWLNDRYGYSVSADGGKSWQRCYGGKKLATEFDEAMIVELKDHDLLLYARCGCGSIAMSRSHDGGKSWSDGTSAEIPAPASRFFLKRLPSGRILLLHNAHPRERRNLAARLSGDECRTWSEPLILDAREPVSYPDAAVDERGVITIIYDRGRCTEDTKEILISRITEADILAGKIITPGSFTARSISRTSTIPYDQCIFQKTKQNDLLWFEQLKK